MRQVWLAPKIRLCPRHGAAPSNHHGVHTEAGRARMGYCAHTTWRATAERDTEPETENTSELEEHWKPKGGMKGIVERTEGRS